MKKKLLILPAVFLLAGCNNQPGTFNTNIPLPKNAIVLNEVEETDAQSFILNTGGEFFNKSSILEIKSSSNVNVKTIDESTKSTMNVSASYNLDMRLGLIMDETINVFDDYFVPKMYANLNDFDLNVTVNMQGINLNFTIADLKLNAYLGLLMDNPVVFLDLSDPSFTRNVKTVASTVMSMFSTTPIPDELIDTLITEFVGDGLGYINLKTLVDTVMSNVDTATQVSEMSLKDVAEMPDLGMIARFIFTQMGGTYYVRKEESTNYLGFALNVNDKFVKESIADLPDTLGFDIGLLIEGMNDSTFIPTLAEAKVRLNYTSPEVTVGVTSTDSIKVEYDNVENGYPAKERLSEFDIDFIANIFSLIE